jgi:hypothetical protein
MINSACKAAPFGLRSSASRQLVCLLCEQPRLDHLARVARRVEPGSGGCARGDDLVLLINLRVSKEARRVEIGRVVQREPCEECIDMLGRSEEAICGTVGERVRTVRS